MEFSTDRLMVAVEALSAFAGRDLSALPSDQVVEVQRAAVLVRNLAEVPLAMADTVLAHRPMEYARKNGHQSNPDMSGTVTGRSGRRVRETIEAGELFGGGGAGGEGRDASAQGSTSAPPPYPLILEAFAAGRLTAEQAALLRRTLEKLAGSAAGLREGTEARLLEKALRMSMRDLRRACDRLVSLAQSTDAHERERAQYEQRAVTVQTDHEGMVVVTARLDPASSAAVTAYLDAHVRAAYQRRQDQDPAMRDTRPRIQIMADAFVMLFTHGLDCDRFTGGVKTQVIVRIDESALRERVADSVGSMGDCDQLDAPLSAASLRHMAVDAELLPLVLNSQSEVLDMGRAQRLFDKRHRIALVERDGGCAFCHAPPAWCVVHHIRWWSRHLGHTSLDNAIMLCVRCHHRIHDDGWGIDIIDGVVWFIPPSHIDESQTPRLGGRAALDITREYVHPGTHRGVGRVTHGPPLYAGG
ncbi:hypothetical protein Lsed01_02002 [Demequina sediminis]|uniref:HNH nuclease domain-containing protein n=1 Tax=Demequina sediminis TaxID=1930058 RepID=A0ABP9WKC0_9MICO|nr:HNH endonuclease signature motif containing protein [Demequina sediminis]BDZ62042.1 hypothetical protein GCM10025873_18330 [Demequina sediminis]